MSHDASHDASHDLSPSWYSSWACAAEAGLAAKHRAPMVVVSQGTDGGVVTGHRWWGRHRAPMVGSSQGTDGGGIDGGVVYTNPGIVYAGFDRTQDL